MTNNPKRTISAAQMAADIRAGMPKEGLMRKYGLSEEQLQTVLRKLRDLRITKKLRAGSPPEPTAKQRQVPRDSITEKVWQCPACKQWQHKVYAECPGCGIVVAKFVPGQADDIRPAGPARLLEEAPATSDGSSWGPVAAGFVALMILGYGIVKWVDYDGEVIVHHEA